MNQRLPTLSGRTELRMSFGLLIARAEVVGPGRARSGYSGPSKSGYSWVVVTKPRGPVVQVEVSPPPAKLTPLWGLGGRFTWSMTLSLTGP